LFTSDGVTLTNRTTSAIRLVGTIGLCPSGESAALKFGGIAEKITATVRIFVAFRSVSTSVTSSTGTVDVADIS